MSEIVFCRVIAFTVAGEIGENVTTVGLDPTKFPLGTRLWIEVQRWSSYGLRTPCALIDRFQKGLKRAMIMKHDQSKFRCGVLGVPFVMAKRSRAPANAEWKSHRATTRPSEAKKTARTRASIAPDVRARDWVRAISLPDRQTCEKNTLKIK